MKRLVALLLLTGCASASPTHTYHGALIWGVNLNLDEVKCEKDYVVFYPRLQINTDFSGHFQSARLGWQCVGNGESKLHYEDDVSTALDDNMVR